MLPNPERQTNDQVPTTEYQMRVAYFINEYPAISHSFIRREIKAMEKLGVSVQRYAIRPSRLTLVDAADELEQLVTRYIAQTSLLLIGAYLFWAVVRRPAALFRTVRLACKIGRKSDRGILRHLVYVVEAIIVAEWCRRDQVEHIHAHFGTNPAAIVMLAHEISGIPYSFTAHGCEEFEKAVLLSLDEKLRHAAFAVAVSSYGRSQLMRWSHPVDWSKIIVARCGVDSGFVQNAIVPVGNAPRLVCVGRLCEHKAQLVLIKATRLVRDAGIACDVVLVGDGPMRPQVEACIKEAGLAKEIRITGWASAATVRAEIVAARALVLPSFAEGLPVVIMEALALGRPVISTYVAGIPELVIPGKTGWLVPASDEESLARAMQEALKASSDRLNEMGMEGRNCVLLRHDSVTEANVIKQAISCSQPAIFI